MNWSWEWCCPWKRLSELLRKNHLFMDIVREESFITTMVRLLSEQVVYELSTVTWHYGMYTPEEIRSRTLFAAIICLTQTQEEVGPCSDNRYLRDRFGHLQVPYLLLFVILKRQYFLHLDTRTAAVSLKYFVLALHILPHRMTGHDSFTKWIVASKGGGSSWMIKNDLSESICQLALMLG